MEVSLGQHQKIWRHSENFLDIFQVEFLTIAETLIKNNLLHSTDMLESIQV